MVAKWVCDFGQIGVCIAGWRAAGIAVTVGIGCGMVRASHIGACGVAARVLHAEDLAGLVVCVRRDRAGASLAALEALLGFLG